MSNKYWIGIDPDSEKNGYSEWFDKKLTLSNLKFFDLFDRIKGLKEGCVLANVELTVIIEAGWLNTKSNWHSYGHGEGVAARIGTKVGANHQTGKLIAEACEYLGIDYQLKKPESSKVNCEYFKKVTGYQCRTNQEQRDAAMLVFSR